MPGRGKKHIPIVSKKQRAFFGAEYARAKAGKKTQTGMSKEVLARKIKDYEKKRKKGKKFPVRVSKKRK
ncbi:MAG: hypothetical protein ACUVWN_16675 [bacterium]